MTSQAYYDSGYKDGAYDGYELALKDLLDVSLGGKQILSERRMSVYEEIKTNIINSYDSSFVDSDKFTYLVELFKIIAEDMGIDRRYLKTGQTWGGDVTDFEKYNTIIMGAYLKFVKQIEYNAIKQTVTRIDI